MYVDGLVSGNNTLEAVEVIKQKSIELFRKDGFNLHKVWNDLKNTNDLTKILGVPWDENRGNLSAVVPEFNEKL